VDSEPLVDADEDVSRMRLLPAVSADLDDGGLPVTADAIRRMRRNRSRGERTRRREQSLSRLTSELSSVEKNQYGRTTRYRTTPPTMFPPLPHFAQTSDDGADADVGSLFRSSRLSSPSSWKTVFDDEEEFQKVVSSRTSTPGKLRSMLAEAGIGVGAKTKRVEQPMMEEAVPDVAETPTAKRLSYAVPMIDDDAAETAGVERVPLSTIGVEPVPLPDSDAEPVPLSAVGVEPVPLPVSDAEPEPLRASRAEPVRVSAAATSPSIVPRSSLEGRLSLAETAVGADVAPAPGSRFVTALSVPAEQRAAEIQRIKESFSSSSVAAADLPSQPSSTTSKAAQLHQLRAGDAATSDVPAQASFSRRARRSSQLDVSDVPTQPSVTKASAKPRAPTFEDITKQRMRILGRPPDEGYTPMLQTPLADSEWETVYEEDLAQSSKPYPFYRTPVMPSSLRSPSPIPQTQTKPRRTWGRGPPGGWTQKSERRYTVPRLSPPKFIQRPVSLVYRSSRYLIIRRSGYEKLRMQSEKLQQLVCCTQRNWAVKYST